MKYSSLLAFVSIGLAGILPAPAAKADPVYEATKVTFNQAVEIPGMVLTPGTYVIKLLDPYVDRDIVRFYNADESHMYAMVFAVRDYRLDLVDHPVITFEERANNAPEAIKEWFPTDENWGEEFVYPKATPIAAQAAVQLAPPQPTAIASAPAPTPAPTPTPAPAPVAQVQPSTAPVEVAQAQPAPVPSRPTAPAAAPAPAKELPKTAGSLPTLTLFGGLLVLAGAMLRRKTS